MNREIKFRGQCDICNEWIEGDLIHGVGSHSGKMYILPNQVNLAYVKHCDPLNGVRVIPESVGQFTGLLDKNSKEIYEGDIIKLEDSKYTYLIEYIAPEFVRHVIEYDLRNQVMPLKSHHKYEVIGNIYETPNKGGDDETT